MRFMSVLVTFLGVFLALFQSFVAYAQSHEKTTITGSIDTSFDGVAIEGLEVSVNGQPATISPDGEFTAQIDLAPIFKIAIEGKSIYRLNQTFGISEVYAHDCDCAKLPPLGIVARKPGRVELFFAGDVMAGRRYSKPIWGERQLIQKETALQDIQRLLEPMRPYIESADLASANLEIVLTDRELDNSPPKSVVFYAPPKLAHALKEVGFDYVSLGNNHSYDYLEEGLATTIDAVESAGLAWSGAGFDEAQSLNASRIEIDGQKLALLGYVGWKGRVEPNQIAEADKGGAAYGSDANIAQSVGREAQAGNITTAQYHGSSEYSDLPSEISERRMKIAIDRGAEIVASHHPHVAHGIELYNGSLIAYSLGNFLFDQYFLETHGSFALKAWLDDGEFVRAEAVPLRILDYRPVPAMGTMRDAVLKRIGRLSQAHGTQMFQNGGHGLILPDKSPMVGKDTISRDEIWTGGLDLLRGGDFENAIFEDAIDRSLKAYGANAKIQFLGKHGHILTLQTDAGVEEASLAPSTFFRAYPGRKIRIAGRIHAASPIQLGISVQSRPKGMGRFKALEEAAIEPAAPSISIAGKKWQDFEFEFQLPDEGQFRPFRPFLTITGGNAGSGNLIALDDLKIISSKAAQ